MQETMTESPVLDSPEFGDLAQLGDTPEMSDAEHVQQWLSEFEYALSASDRSEERRVGKECRL